MLGVPPIRSHSPNQGRIVHEKDVIMEFVLLVIPS